MVNAFDWAEEQILDGADPREIIEVVSLATIPFGGAVAQAGDPAVAAAKGAAAAGVSAVKGLAKAIKRCPAGSQKNPQTGECEPVRGAPPPEPMMKAPEPGKVPEPTEVPEPEMMPEPEPMKEPEPEACPEGMVRDRTGVCVFPSKEPEKSAKKPVMRLTMVAKKPEARALEKSWLEWTLRAS